MTAPSKKPKQSELLLAAVAASGAEILRSDADRAWARVGGDAFPLDGKDGGRWLQRLAQDQGFVPSRNALADARAVLDAHAGADGGPEHVRVAWPEDRTAVWLDLGGRAGARRYAHIVPDGWSVCSGSPPGALMMPGRMPLPEPLPPGEGSFGPMREVLGLAAGDWALAAAWLVNLLRPARAYPILQLLGLPGAGKSELLKALRALVDPHVAMVRRSVSADPRELASAARGSWVLAYDNLTGASQEVSNAMCAVATGDGIVLRELYTTSDEHAVAVTRPIGVTAIGEPFVRGDAVDRSWILELPARTERVEDVALEARLAKARPAALGALLDAVAIALRECPPNVLRSAGSGRMLGHERWGCAAADALGSDPGTMRAALDASTARGKRTVADGSPLLRHLRWAAHAKHLTPADGWHTAREWLRALHESVEGSDRRYVPQSAKKLGVELMQLVPSGAVEHRPYGRGARRGLAVYRLAAA